MNKFFGFLLIFLVLSQANHSQELVQQDTLSVQEDKIHLNWMSSYKDALKQSKKDKKPVMVYFTGSDWCPPCKVLDKELFHTEKFKNFSDDKLVLLEVDIPRRQDLLSQDKMSENLYLKKKFKVKSFPTLIFLNHRGKKIAEKKGYVLTEYYFPFIQSVVYNY